MHANGPNRPNYGALAVHSAAIHPQAVQPHHPNAYQAYPQHHLQNNNSLSLGDFVFRLPPSHTATTSPHSIGGSADVAKFFGGSERGAASPPAAFGAMGSASALSLGVSMSASNLHALLGTLELDDDAAPMQMHAVGQRAEIDYHQMHGQVQVEG